MTTNRAQRGPYGFGNHTAGRPVGACAICSPQAGQNERRQDAARAARHLHPHSRATGGSVRDLPTAGAGKGGMGMTPTKKLPLFLVSGASCVGKTSLCEELFRSETDYIVLESDLI